MDEIVGTRGARFALVTAAHHFLVAALPLRNPDSRNALIEFVEHVGSCPLPAPEVDAVLLRCLSILDSYTGGRLPSLVESYLAQRSGVRDGPTRFQRSVEDLFRHRAIAHPLIRQAVAILEDRCSDPHLRQRSVATSLGLGAAECAAKFKTWTGQTFSEHLRNARLGRAAALLVSSTKSIKEVWAQVGYNHPSNFDHDFKRRFNVTPREYRARVIGSVMNVEGLQPQNPHLQTQSEKQKKKRRTVLIVDDDEDTRETIGRYLTLKGYKVVVASTGNEGLRQAARLEPQAILLDYHLPDIDGLTCLRALRRQNVSTRPTVVLFTADWELELESREVQALGAKLASKLCDLEEVQRLLADP